LARRPRAAFELLAGGAVWGVWVGLRAGVCRAAGCGPSPKQQTQKNKHEIEETRIELSLGTCVHCLVRLVRFRGSGKRQQSLLGPRLMKISEPSKKPQLFAARIGQSALDNTDLYMTGLGEST